MEQLSFQSHQIEIHPSRSTLLIKKQRPFNLQTIQFIPTNEDNTMPALMSHYGIDATTASMEGNSSHGASPSTTTTTTTTTTEQQQEEQSTTSTTTVTKNDTPSKETQQGLEKLLIMAQKTTKSITTNSTTTTTTHHTEQNGTAPPSSTDDDKLSPYHPSQNFTILNNRVIIHKHSLKEMALYLKHENVSMDDFFKYHDYMEYKRNSRHGWDNENQLEHSENVRNIRQLMDNPSQLQKLTSQIHHIGNLRSQEDEPLSEQLYVKKNDKRRQLVVCFKWRDDSIQKKSTIRENGAATEIDDIQIQVTSPDEADYDTASMGDEAPTPLSENTPSSVSSPQENGISFPRENGATSIQPRNSTSTTATDESLDLSDFLSLIFYKEKDAQYMDSNELRAIVSSQKEAIAAKDAVIQREESQIETLRNEIATLRFQFSSLQEQNESLKYSQVQIEKRLRRELDAKELELERVRAEFDVVKEKGCRCTIL